MPKIVSDLRVRLEKKQNTEHSIFAIAISLFRISLVKIYLKILPVISDFLHSKINKKEGLRFLHHCYDTI